MLPTIKENSSSLLYLKHFTKEGRLLPPPILARLMLLAFLCSYGITEAHSSTIENFIAQNGSPAGKVASPIPIFRFIEGLDSQKKELSHSEISNELNDPWARLVLRKGKNPEDLNQILAALLPFELRSENPLIRSSFVVAEGSQIPLGNDDVSKKLNRNFRLVVLWDAGQDERIFLSTPAGDRFGFHELISWDPQKEAFNYYRRQKGNQWIWRGDTRHAFKMQSRGNGCFKCHTNGTLVMKELKRPWNNWSTEEASISAEAVPRHIRPPDQPQIRALFDEHKLAQILENKVRAGIAQANRARLKARKGKINNTRSLFRQLIDSRNVNLVTSGTKGISSTAGSHMRIPITFFINWEAFRILGFPLKPVNTSVSWGRYLQLISDSGFQFALIDGEFRQIGDTYFAFFVPEPAAEDIDLLRRMVQNGLVPPKLAASFLMVDFPNPVYSPRRNHLLRYLGSIPDSMPGENNVSDPSRQLAENIRKVAQTQSPCKIEDPAMCTPEQEFVRFWLSPDENWRVQFAAQIQNYLKLVSESLQDSDKLKNFIMLSISRRHDFKTSAPGANLFETNLLFPRTNLDPNPPFLQMTIAGKVKIRSPKIPNFEFP